MERSTLRNATLAARVAGACVVWLSGSSTAAADVPVVEIGRAGPKGSPPLDRPFYLELDDRLFKNAVRVDALFIRYWSRPFGAQPLRPDEGLRSCTAVEAEVKPWQLRPDVQPGAYNVAGVWQKTEGSGRLGRGRRVLVAKPWKKTPGDDGKDRRLLVDGRTFFTSGARYCLLVYAQVPEGKNAKLRDAAEKFAKAVARGFKDTGSNTDLIEAQAKIELDNLKKNYCGAPGTGKSGADNCKTDDTRVRVTHSGWAAFRKSFRSSGFGAAVRIVRRRRELTRLSSCADRLALPKPRAVASKLGLSVDTGVGRLIAELGASKGALSRDAGAGYRTNDGKFTVASVELLEEPGKGRIEGVRVYDGTGSKSARIALPPTTAIDAAGTSIEDLVLFARGLMVYGGQVQPIGTVLRDTGGSNQWKSPPPELTKDFNRLTGLLQTLSKTAPTDLPSNDTRRLLAELGKDVRALTVTDAKHTVSDVCKKHPIPNGAVDRATYPLAAWLDTVAAEYRSARKQWAVTTGKGELPAYARSLLVTRLLEEGYTQERYVADYVTLFQGFAAVVPAGSPSDTFFLPYVGVQISAAPNPVDRPMWSRGRRDFARLFSFELAVAELRQDLGPQGRFQGIAGGRFPPVLFGAAAQLIPWVTFSAGGVVLERRRSIFPGEGSSRVVRWYVAATVQANIPGIIGKLSGRERTTKKTD